MMAKGTAMTIEESIARDKIQNDRVAAEQAARRAPLQALIRDTYKDWSDGLARTRARRAAAVAPVPLVKT